MFLSNSVNPANPLFNLHGVPWQIVIYHDMAELKIDTLAASIRRNHYLGIFPEHVLLTYLFVQVHATVNNGSFVSQPIQAFNDILLCLNELCENQYLNVLVVFLSLDFLNNTNQASEFSVISTYNGILCQLDTIRDNLNLLLHSVRIS